MNEKHGLQMGPVSLNIRHIQPMLEFYGDLVGLEIITSNNNLTVLGSGKTEVLKLYVEEKFRNPSPNSAGLYHTAILYSSRTLLAEAVKRLIESKPNLYQGSADHLVSEAFYFADPEGNGVELYFDKPQSSWQYDANGKLIMGSEYINEIVYLADHLTANRAEGNIKLGHIHLKVGDIEKAKEFYVRKLGFDLIMEMPTALFVSKDGYHHHIGMNIWQSVGAPMRETDTLGLRSFELISTDGKNETIQDPWGNEITFT